MANNSEIVSPISASGLTAGDFAEHGMRNWTYWFFPEELGNLDNAIQLLTEALGGRWENQDAMSPEELLAVWDEVFPREEAACTSTT